jgi:hypothetical protein
MLDNAEWLDRLHYIPFLRDVGRHFSVNRMLTMDSVRLRLERDQPMSFLEFNYMLLQSFDFLELHRRHGVVLQMGGSDQWGNIVMGADLVRRMAGAEAFGLTTPLLTTAAGAKMGKTAAGAVWLNPDRLAPYDYWQFWRNAADADVGRFLALFTELPMEEVRRWARWPAPRSTRQEGLGDGGHGAAARARGGGSCGRRRRGGPSRRARPLETLPGIERRCQRRWWTYWRGEVRGEQGRGAAARRAGRRAAERRAGDGRCAGR